MLIAPWLLMTSLVAPLPQSSDAQQNQTPVVTAQSGVPGSSSPAVQSKSPVTKKKNAAPPTTGTGTLTATGGATDAVAAQQGQGPGGAETDDPGAPSSVERPHTFGLGGALGLSTRGGGAGTRVWFGQHVGVDMNVNWLRGLQTSTVGGSSSTFLAVPSVLFMFTKQHPTQEVDLRPYVGAGANYTSTSQPLLTPTSVSSTYRVAGMGSQVFGGVEATFKDFRMMTISAEVTHYDLPTIISTPTVQNGTNFYVSLHFYVK